MKNITQLFWILSDSTRLRILMLLSRQELCVCQLMGILGISQPLVSRNIALLWEAGLLDDRRQGKLAFYVLKKGLPTGTTQIMDVLKKHLKNDPTLIADIRSMKDCQAFQKKSGACDMKTFLAFMAQQSKRK